MDSQECSLYFSSLFLSGGFYKIPFKNPIQQVFFKMASSIKSLNEESNLYLYFFCYAYLSMASSPIDDKLWEALKYLLKITEGATMMLQYTILLLNRCKDDGIRMDVHDAHLRNWLDIILNYNEEAKFSLATLVDLMELTQNQAYREEILKRIVEKSLHVKYVPLRKEELNKLSDFEFLDICICFDKEIAKCSWKTQYKRRFREIKDENQKDDKYVKVSNILCKHSE